MFGFCLFISTSVRGVVFVCLFVRLFVCFVLFDQGAWFAP